MTKQQKSVLAAILLFLLLGVVLAAYLARQITRPTPRAAQRNLTFNFQSSNPAPATGDEFTVSVFATAPQSSSVGNIGAYIKFNSEIMELVKITPGDEIPESGPPFSSWIYARANQNPNTGQIEIIAGYAGTNEENFLAPNQTALFANIKFRWIGGEDSTAEVVLTTESEAKDPDGETIIVEGAMLRLPVADGEEPTEEPTEEPGQVHSECFEGQCVEVEGEGDDQCEVDSDCVGETPTEPPVDPNAPRLSFKIAFQGVTPQTIGRERPTEFPDPKEQKVHVKIVHPTLQINKTYEDVPVAYSEDDSTDAKAVYTGGTHLTGVQPGSGYLVFIKGPRHLQKLFCQDRPAGPCQSRLNSQITLQEGVNEYDFSTLSLEAGDLPDPDADMAQDGVVDARDWERLRSFMTIFPSDQTGLHMLVGDLDLSGKIDTGDAGLIQDTLFKEYEEDEEAVFETF